MTDASNRYTLGKGSVSSMGLLVQKYGGSSLQTPKHIKRAAARIRDLKNSGCDLVVVVSAMGHTTDHLVKLAKKTVKRPPERELDMLLTAGERVSMSLLAMALYEEGVPAISFTGSQSGILTDNKHTDAKILEIRGHRIEEELKRGKVVIIAGFQGVSAMKEITTLGRGGSDTTAVALAANLKAERCEILTDVNGLFTADPRIVSSARLISSCTYDEALEMASLGAKMQPRSIQLAKKFGVKLTISSSANFDVAGTQVGDSSRGEKMEKTQVRGVTTKAGFYFFKVETTIRQLLGGFSELGLVLRFFNFSDSTVSFLVEEDKAQKVKDFFSKVSLKYAEIPKVALVSAVGDGINHSPEVMPAFVEAIQSTGAECLLLTSNTLSVNAAVSETAMAKCAEILHSKLVTTI